MKWIVELRPITNKFSTFISNNEYDTESVDISLEIESLYFNGSMIYKLVNKGRVECL